MVDLFGGHDAKRVGLSRSIDGTNYTTATVITTETKRLQYYGDGDSMFGSLDEDDGDENEEPKEEGVAEGIGARIRRG